jgi:DNA-binding CsgD family transcriptional regulator
MADAINDLIDTIYRASEDDEAWPLVLDGIAAGLAGRASTLFQYDHQAASTDFVFASGFTPGSAEAYGKYFSKLDVRLHRLVSDVPSGRIVTGDQLLPNAEFARSEFYQDFFRPQNLFHVLGGAVAKSDTSGVFVAVQRTRDNRAFGAQERRTLLRLIPHLDRAIRLRARFEELRLRNDALAGAMDSLTFGLALADVRGRIRYANLAARAIWAQADGISLGRAGTLVVPGAVGAALSAAIEKMALSPFVLDQCLDAWIRVPRQSGKRAYGVLVAPIRPGQSLSKFASQAILVLIIVDPEVTPRAPASHLALQFDLTPAQANFAVCIASGLSIEEACDQLGIKRNTGRTHMTQLLSKTGAHRQGELMRVLLSLPVARARE